MIKVRICSEHKYDIILGKGKKPLKSAYELASLPYVQASRPGLNHGLCRHHRAQVEGVEGPMGKVPQVVTRKGDMPAPHTRLQHLVDSKVLLEKKRRSDTTCLTSSRGRNRLFRTRELVSMRYRLLEPEGDSGLRYLLLATPCGDKQPLTTRTMCSSAVEVTLDRPHRT